MGTYCDGTQNFIHDIDRWLSEGTEGCGGTVKMKQNFSLAVQSGKALIIICGKKEGQPYLVS